MSCSAAPAFAGRASEKQGGFVLPFFIRLSRPFTSLRLLALSAALATLALSHCRADGDLTLEFPPSQAAQEARAAPSAPASEIPQTSSAPVYHDSIRKAKSARRSKYSSRAGYVNRSGIVNRSPSVGTLGVLKRVSNIYRDHDWNSLVLTKAESGTYLALRGIAGNWYGVLMADGSTGYVPKGLVTRMAYEVVNTGGSVAPTGEDPGDIYPRSATPYFQSDPQALLNEAYRYLGVRYVWGGNTARGIDCSGFVKNVYATQGYRFPRLGSDQMAYGVPVPKDQLMAGDRLYFGRRTNRVGVTHTGIYIGGGYFIHASSSRHGVAISHLNEELFARIYVCARR